MNYILDKLSSNPRVTIITVCFNSEKTIKGTIESVLSQDYKNIEFIIVDADSSDETKNIIQQFNGNKNTSSTSTYYKLLQIHAFGASYNIR